MTKNEYDGRKTLTGTERVVDGKNIFSFEHHELIVHSVLPQIIPSYLDIDDFDYAASDTEWKYLVGFAESSDRKKGWYNFAGYGYIDEDSDPEIFSKAGGSCSNGCLFHLETDPNEYVDLSDEYPEVATYFADLLDAIYIGGFDESYHSGKITNKTIEV